MNLNQTVASNHTDVFHTMFVTYNSSSSIPAILTTENAGCPAPYCKLKSDYKLTMDVSIAIFCIAIFGFLGWFLFMVYAGIGLFSLPVDLINAFLTRPAYMTASKYGECRKTIDKRLTELLEIAETIEQEIEKT